jgi:hypothetical protein
MRRGGKMMNHYEFTSKGVRTFCFGEGELSEALRSGASEVVNYGRVYVFRDRHGFPTWVSEGMLPGMWGDLSEEAFEEVMSH